MSEGILEQENVAFLYQWYDRAKDMYYIGSHRGNPDDGYVCSSKPMLEQYKKRPEDFEREILLIGEFEYIREMEAEYLKNVDAKYNDKYYNMHNGDGKFYCITTTEEHKKNIGIALTGKTRTEEQRKRMSEIQKALSVPDACIEALKNNRHKNPACQPGYEKTPEHRKNIAEGTRKAHEEGKLSVSHLQTKECRAKMAESKKKGRIDEKGRECSKCGTYKSWNEFCPNGYAKTGYKSQCKNCEQEYKKSRKKRLGL